MGVILIFIKPLRHSISMDNKRKQKRKNFPLPLQVRPCCGRYTNSERDIMHKILLLFTVTTLVGCAAAGVMYTNDPYKKVSNSYIMMSQGRSIPAERFANEAYEQFKQNNDVFGQGESLVALGLLYKSTLKHNITESVAKFEQAVVLFQSINDYSSLAKTKFALGNAYANSEEKEKRCPMYAESLQDYEKAEKLNPEASFKFNPAYPSFDAMVKDFESEYCG